MSIVEDLEIILEFVERHNKNDVEQEVAAAALRLDTMLDPYREHIIEL